MRIVLFYHSLLSDWNHGNAHFLRGITTELMARSHTVSVYEPRGAWSMENLLAERGDAAIADFHRAYPHLESVRYAPRSLDLDQVLDGADLVIVHEWNEHDLVARIGAHRAHSGRYRLLFHDTHHRALTHRGDMAAYDLRHYDGVLAFGSVIRDIYLDAGWTERAWTWHEAADTRVFHPLAVPQEGDLVWVGNWGDGERSAELDEFLLGPARDLKLRTRIHGVRYPAEALSTLARCGIDYGGWVANFHVPQLFGGYRVTVHVPRRPYVEALPGIPTIRPFEALACGIPLVSAPWEDREGLFRPGTDYLIARDGTEMRQHLRAILHDDDMAQELARNGRETILGNHTCAHRVNELLAIGRELGLVDPA